MAASSDGASGAKVRPPDAASPRSASPAPPEGGGTSGPVSSEGVDGIVQDIREELAQISARELELRRREQDFGREYRDLKQAARQAAEEEYEQAQQRLAEQAAELNAQAVDIAARRARLNELAQKLRARQIELEQQRSDLALRTQQSRQQAESLRSWQTRQEQVLKERLEGVRRQEQELTKRIQRAHDDVTRQRAELERRNAELEARAARLEKSEQALLERRTELERRLSQGEVLATEVERHHGELATEWTRLEQERGQFERTARELEAERARVAREWNQLEDATHELEAERARLAEGRGQLQKAKDDLEAERNALLEKQKELDQRWQATDEQRHQLAHQVEELEAQRRGLDQDQASLEERAERLARREEQFHEKTAALEAEKKRLAELEAELDQRHDELLALREQTEARENESRQAALVLEVERQALESERAAREQADQQPNEALARREQDLERARAVLAERVESLRQPERSSVAAPRPWRLRSTGIAAVVALLAASAWFVGHPPLFRATTRIQIASANPAVAEVTSEHRRRLFDPHLLDQGGRDVRHGGLTLHVNGKSQDERATDELAEAWRTACEDGRVAVSAADGETVLWLSTTARDGEDARRLARAACEAYARRAQDRSADAGPPAGYQDLVSRHEQLQATLQALRQQQAADETTLADVSELQEREEVAAAADGLEVELADAGTSLDEAGAELAALLSAAVPRASVDPADVEKALAEDAIYQEDRQESRAAALQYRTELSVAMVQLVDPAEGVRKALTEFAASLQEQRALDPPARIGAVLEECAADVSRAQAQFTPFAEQWHTWLKTVQSMDVRDDVVGLVTQQNTVADAARRRADEAVAIVDDLGARIEGLSSDGDGGTREVVVAAVLRSDHAALNSAVETFLAVAGKTALTENFELDTHARKLRGLRVRLSNRREAISQRLQLEADRAARDEHAARVEQAGEQVRRLERRRERLVTNLMTTLRRLRSLDAAARRRDELEVQARQRVAEIAWLEARTAELELELADARQHRPEPDRVKFGQPVTVRVQQAGYRNTALAAAAGFAATWLICALMVAKPPWRRRVDTEPPDSCD